MGKIICKDFVWNKSTSASRSTWEDFVHMQSGTVLVTGGAGFIGSNFVLQWISDESTPLTILDKLTYAGNLSNLAKVSSEPRYRLVQGDIGDRELVRTLIA